MLTREEHSKRFTAILQELQDLHDRKNNNYAEDSDPMSNLRECEKFNVPALLGVMVRMSDKWSRMIQLIKGKVDLVGESLKDTVRDLIVYLIMFMILLEEKE